MSNEELRRLEIRYQLYRESYAPTPCVKVAKDLVVKDLEKQIEKARLKNE